MSSPEPQPVWVDTNRHRSMGTADLALEFVELNSYLHAGGDQESALQRLIDLAVTAIDGCEWAGLTAWPQQGRPYSLACSDDVAASVDGIQHELQDGPCLRAADATMPVRVEDVTADRRWPIFCEAVAARTPVRSVLAFPIQERPVRAALNLYSGQRCAFGAETQAGVALFAAHARILLMHAAQADKAANLHRALGTSRQIGEAIGILMGIHKLSEAQAFEQLRASSQHLNRKLAEIAEHVTMTGDLPER
ncbi:GAF and ANTAR domain-containing protein [Terrabacter sp. NPDC000476]|uniref:GAF and ANTAR domain-containing protein n=1 Tax=Terrabacter sp. NPDC000476 TaxID=3154258 RepID=UPI00332B2833